MAGIERLLRLDGKLVAITGAGQGIGRAAAALFAEAGARIVAIDIAAERLASLAADLAGVATRVCDIADEAAVEACFAGIAAEIGPLYGLVHAAAVFPSGLSPA